MKKYDLKDRVTKFSKEVIALSRELSLDAISRPLISQLVRSATSVGANYMEANGAHSEKDFAYKLFICKKEAQEAEYWLELILDIFPDRKNAILVMKQECHELVLIFSKASKTTKRKIEIGN